MYFFYRWITTDNAAELLRCQFLAKVEFILELIVLCGLVWLIMKLKDYKPKRDNHEKEKI